MGGCLHARARGVDDFREVGLHCFAERGGVSALQAKGFDQETHRYQPRGGLYSALQVADGALTQPSALRELLLRQPAGETLTAQQLRKRRAHSNCILT